MTAVVTTRKRENTRERLLDAARLVLAETGIQGATVETICERAGFSRGAFYSNYESKDELILALFRRERDRLMVSMHESFDAEFGQTSTGLEAVPRFLDRFLTAYLHDRVGFLVHQEFITHGTRDRSIGAVYREMWEQTRQDVERVLVAGTEALGRRLIVPAEQATLMVLGGFEMVMRTTFLDHDRDTVDVDLLGEIVTTLMTTWTEDADASPE